MRKTVILAAFVISCFATWAQKEVQHLQPARLGIFKNGTCFIKREGTVNVSNRSFYLRAPENVLMGTYWIMVGKESNLHSITVKTDTFKVMHDAKDLSDYLRANTGQNINLYGNVTNTELTKLSGKLVAYDPDSKMMRLVTSTGKTVVVSADFFDWYETGDMKSRIPVDSIINVAKVKLGNDAGKTLVSTISLEKGIQWFPSYLFTIINDKEAKLELKATIANGNDEYRNMPVDIIIGSPEMFYQQQLDPVCVDYLGQSLLGPGYDNNSLNSGFNLAYTQISNNAPATFSAISPSYSWAADDEGEYKQKEGQKLEDLYYYQLGNVDLEKNSRVIVPVMNATVLYSEIYTADLPLNSPSAEGENAIQAYRSYLISNNTTAPFTTGPALVINQQGQPMAQAQLTYTPVKGNCEMQLSKAIDVQVKNEEEETAREKSTLRKTSGSYYEKVVTSGVIKLTNYKDKKIKIRVTKNVNGIFSVADNQGKSRKAKSINNALTEIYWEVEIEAGARLDLKYDYYVLR